MYLGFDSSTQSCSATVICPQRGEIVHESSVNFGQDLPAYKSPQGFLVAGDAQEVHADPLMWLAALDLLLARMCEAGVDLSAITALSGSGQQHGSVYLGESFRTRVADLHASDTLVDNLATTLARRTSPIWMDGSTTAQCAEISALVGGEEEVCARSGSVTTPRFTGPQIRKFAQSDPVAYRETTTIHLVSSFLCSVLAGTSAPLDIGDAAGMNLLNLSTQSWDHDLVAATAPDLIDKLPAVAKPGDTVGPISRYFVDKYGFSPECLVAPWSGDNPCSLVGMGASAPGTAVISLGTSDTLFAAMPAPHTDPHGYGHVFGNPIGGYMSLLCFANGSLAREQLKNDYGLTWADFDAPALAHTPAGNNARLLLPFYSDEISPRVRGEGPIYSPQWQEADEANPNVLVRATLEGQFLNMYAQSRWMNLELDHIRLTGGASQSDGICQIIADIFGCPVTRLETTGSAALGAALLAAVANGESLPHLEQALCQTTAPLTPDPAATATYRQLHTAYADLLALALTD